MYMLREILSRGLAVEISKRKKKEREIFSLEVHFPHVLYELLLCGKGRVARGALE